MQFMHAFDLFVRTKHVPWIGQIHAASLAFFQKNDCRNQNQPVISAMSPGKESDGDTVRVFGYTVPRPAKFARALSGRRSSH